MDALLTFDDEAGNRFEIYADEDAKSPREDDNLGTIYSNHRDYNPDKHLITELNPLLINKRKLDRDYIWLKIWAYIHGGVSITAGERTYPYNDTFDSGLFGIIAVKRDKVRKEYDVKRINPSLKKKVLDVLAAEVDTLNMYYNDDVYGFKMFNPQGEEIDSCWGFYADDLDKLKEELLAEYGEKKED